MDLKIGDKIVKITSLLLFFLEGIVSIVASRVIQKASIFHLIGLGILWAAVLIVLFSIKLDEEMQVRTYVFIAVYATTFLSIYNVHVFGNPYMFILFQFVLWLILVSGARKYVLTAMTITNILVVSVLFFFIKMISLLDYISMTICLLVCYWISFMYVNRIENLMVMIMAQNQSYDDMIELIESRFSEEKGANDAKSAFLANMSHEIRTPINAILGLNTMTLRESKEETIKEYAREIDGAGQTLLSLVNDILDISKVESGKMEIIPVEYDFSSMINDVVTMISYKASAKGLRLNVNVAQNIPCLFYGDDVRIRQVLVNLLSNAVKYTEKGSITLSAGCEVSGEHAIISFSISDTGIGIKEEDMEKLFSKFERLDKVRNRNVEGTGLGMAITKKLLALMNSNLDVKSKYGEGSTFSFYLMQRVVNATPIGDINVKYNRAKTEISEKNEFIAPDAQILIVDDNKTNRMVFSHLLKRLMVKIDEADSGQAAINKVNEKKYDIIFLDHMMPGMDGIETLGHIKENSEGPNINTPVIALTANAISGSRELYMSAGFNDYLSKPIDPKKLEGLIFNHLSEEKKESV